MRTLAFQPKVNKQTIQKKILAPTCIGFFISLIFHIALAATLLDFFHNVDVQQNGDSAFTLSLATFQTPSNSKNVEDPKPITHKKKKKRTHKERIKDNGKLAQTQEESNPATTKSPQAAKVEKKTEEGEVIQTLSYRDGTENDVFSKIKAAIDKKNKYPPMARKRGLEGQVVAGFIIHKNGRVTDIKILKPSPNDSFNVAAINAIKKSQHDFPTLNTTTKIELPIVYELKK